MQGNLALQEQTNLRNSLEDDTNNKPSGTNITKKGLHLCWNKALHREGSY